MNNTENIASFPDVWVYFGEVIPRNSPVTFKKINQFVSYDLEGIDISFNIFVTENNLILETFIKKGFTTLSSLKVISEFFVRTMLCTITYCHGLLLNVEILSGVNIKTGQKLFFGNSIDFLKREKFDKTNLTEINRVTKALSKDSTLRYVLENFRLSLSIPLDTGLYCYRSIESMMQSMKDDVSSKLNPKNADKIHWERLRSALNVSEETLKSIGNHASFPRHGKPNSLTIQQREVIIFTTDKIIERYIEYLLLDKHPINKLDFPLISNVIK